MDPSGPGVEVLSSCHRLHLVWLERGELLSGWIHTYAYLVLFAETHYSPFNMVSFGTRSNLPLLLERVRIYHLKITHKQKMLIFGGCI